VNLIILLLLIRFDKIFLEILHTLLINIIKIKELLNFIIKYISIIPINSLNIGYLLFDDIIIMILL